jgi:hypothetical protein
VGVTGVRRRSGTGTTSADRAGYDSGKTRDELQSGGVLRWPVERTNAWHSSFNRLQRCYERKR